MHFHEVGEMVKSREVLQKPLIQSFKKRFNVYKRIFQHPEFEFNISHRLFSQVMINLDKYQQMIVLNLRRTLLTVIRQCAQQGIHIF